MNKKTIKNITQGALTIVIGGEIYLISRTFYKLYTENVCMTFAGGLIRVPYFILIELIAIPIAPIVVKSIGKIISNNKIADDTDLVGLFKKIKKEEE